MICPPCRKGAVAMVPSETQAQDSYEKAVQDGRLPSNAAIVAAKMHESCEAPATCPCHHVVVLPGEVTRAQS